MMKWYGGKEARKKWVEEEAAERRGGGRKTEHFSTEVAKHIKAQHV